MLLQQGLAVHGITADTVALSYENETSKNKT